MLDVPPKKSKVYELRRQTALSQGQLARKADLDPGTVSAAENGKPVTDNTKIKLAGAFTSLLGREVSPEDI